jgi:hypothetical protein
MLMQERRKGVVNRARECRKQRHALKQMARSDPFKHVLFVGNVNASSSLVTQYQTHVPFSTCAIHVQSDAAS